MNEFSFNRLLPKSKIIFQGTIKSMHQQLERVHAREFAVSFRPEEGLLLVVIRKSSFNSKLTPLDMVALSLFEIKINPRSSTTTYSTHRGMVELEMRGVKNGEDISEDIFSEGLLQCMESVQSNAGWLFARPSTWNAMMGKSYYKTVQRVEHAGEADEDDEATTSEREPEQSLHEKDLQFLHESESYRGKWIQFQPALPVSFSEQK